MESSHVDEECASLLKNETWEFQLERDNTFLF